jgi:catechol 2,3-dioxygenase-like lactoylglutathione lyase family enzyme
MTLSSTANMTAIEGVDLIGAVVPDIKRSIAYYRDTLGLVPTSPIDGDGAEFTMNDGITYGLWQPGEPTPPHYSVMFRVADAGKAIAEMRTRGGDFLDVESPVCYMGIGHDPDGNSVIVHQRKAHDVEPAPQHARSTTSINGADMYGFFVSDVQRSLTYYRDVLGLQPAELDEQARGAEFTLADGSSFGFWCPPDGSKTSGGFTMFAVADAKAKIAELRAKGVAIDDPMETPVCFMAFTPDPDGNTVIIHQRKA